jgi:hypothetical protein
VEALRRRLSATAAGAQPLRPSRRSARRLARRRLYNPRLHRISTPSDVDKGRRTPRSETPAKPPSWKFRQASSRRRGRRHRPAPQRPINRADSSSDRVSRQPPPPQAICRDGSPDLLPDLKGGGSRPPDGSYAPSPGLQRPLGPGSWGYPGQHRGSSAPAGGLGLGTPAF